MKIAATFRKRLSAKALAIAVFSIATSAALAAGGGSFLKPVKPGSVVFIPPPSEAHHMPEPGPVATPTVPPALPTEVGKGELAAVVSNFNVSALLVPSWGTGATPSSAKPDVVGAFRFICNASHLAKDDPIVYPGQSGQSHLHQFFGNTKADAHSTYESLRSTGDSTCGNILNRSAYWMPAMLDGKGSVVVPDYVSVYYKRMPANDPNCARQGAVCVGLPRGLRFVFGFNMSNPKDSPTGAAYFNCDGATATPGHYPDIVSAAANCPTGNRLGAVINAPDCWNGKDLDSPDHRSHVAYSGYGDWGYLKCPSTHPYIIPTFTMGVWYTTDQNLDRSGTWTTRTSTWHLSSDEMAGMPPMRPGSTFHSDWFGAWDDNVMKAWTENCVDKLLNCSGGDLGNGWQMKERESFTWNANPRVVPIPSL
ncbi:DUF1996 domain-containing protein [Sphingomonas sp. M1-B02]|uniref:DUF1996 domain-containing protein n=1 Tax=Sphingomonas sp. M1-B02 TaxID=3114300 RepID=UPI0022407CFF|nr:DUF1996 domain-containing protein [Sphingomonas sp. S6-11]UZK67740.1 DUF1996 domain-containing protein [Sphingomonas sp. S6-11]